MALKNRVSVAAISAALCAVLSAPVMADIWVVEPSITLDQRFDDNYYLLLNGEALSATRGVAEFGLSREAADYRIKGLARVDALFSSESNEGREDLESNYIFAIEARRSTARSRFGVKVNYKKDTPSRDIEADISDNTAFAKDTSLLLTQTYSNNVARVNSSIEPSFEYDITRRLQFDVKGSLKDITHDLPDVNDTIYDWYLALPEGETRPASQPIGQPYGTIVLGDADVFSPSSELSDYREAALTLGLRFKLTPVVTLTGSASYKQLETQVLASNKLEPFSTPPQFTVDPDSPRILRRFRRDEITTTTRFTLGYERLLSPTLRFVIDGGVYNAVVDNSDTYRPGDVLRNPLDRPNVGETEKDGWVASVALTYDAGATKYSARYAVDVVPSSAGSQLETNQLTGEVRRTISPRLNVSFRGRAFEPDRLVSDASDTFARRFISFEPGVQWQYSRNWTATAAYRYRRQKARVALEPSESNAILLAIKYTPPSEVRDTARANGL